MNRYRNYWIYRIGLAIAWAIVLFLVLMIKGSESAQTGLTACLLLFTGLLAILREEDLFRGLRRVLSIGACAL